MESICRSKQAPFLKTFSMINGKWKLRILYELACEKILRYSELKRNLTPITHKMLSTQLKELEEDGIIIRKEYPQVPPKVEYSLTKKGSELKPIFDLMNEYGNKYKKK